MKYSDGAFMVRFRRSYVKLESGCWEWLRAKSVDGYGHSYQGGRVRIAHRLAYEFYRGPIPEGLEIDHLCRNRACVNPDHLEPVTHKENCRRGNQGKRQRAKTHCPKGHPYTGDNLYTYKRLRACRICRAAADLRYRKSGKRLAPAG